MRKTNKNDKQKKHLGLKKKITKKKAKINSKKLEKKGKPEFIGILDHVSPFFGFVVIEGQKNDLKVSDKNLLGAFHGDKVKVLQKKNNAKIIEILERNRIEFVGKLIKNEQHEFIVQLDGKRFHYDVLIPNKEALSTAKMGDKVIVKIEQWPTKTKLALGSIKKIFGKSGEHHTEMDSIMFEFDLPIDFPNEVLEEANKIESLISKEEIENRKDFRDILTFTIDPENAKDYDDALSIQQLKNGNFEIGIHIADASFYVKEDSFLDKEAYNRGNSVYLVDRTIPMLPEKLSNHLCSLRPNEDSLTFSVIFEIDKNAKIIKSWLGEGIIHSRKKFIYEEAQENIDNAKGEYFKELIILNDLAKKIRAKRFSEGSIYFSSPEFKIRLDDEGNPINVFKKEEIETNNLIEEFMLLANKEVAQRISKLKLKNKDIPFIYRVHDRPNKEKLDELGAFLKVFKYKFDTNSNNLPPIFNALAEDFKNKPEFSIIQYYAIRSMARAEYSPENISHFGLGFKDYTHFTSPIRRYADLEVHRILKKRFLERYKNVNIEKKNYKKITEKISNTEKNASDAERASIKYKQVIYTQSLKGKVLKGMISYISEKSLFVELLDSGCEGAISFADLKGDYYELDKKTFSAIGQRKRKKYKIGDRVDVEIKACDVDKRITQFWLVEDN